VRLAGALILCAACGSVSDNQHLDAGPEDATPDGRVPTCADAEFTTSAPVAVLNSAADEVFLRLSADELTAYFSRLGAAGPTSAFIATRASVTSPFNSPAPLTITGNAGAEVTSPTVTADGLTLYFISNRTGTAGAGDIWKATRASTTANFADIVSVSELNSTADEMDVFVLPDGNTIYFSTARNGGVYTIFRAEKSGANFDAPVQVLSNGSAFLDRVAVTSDELQLFYQAGNDVQVSKRTSITEPFAAGTPITALNSPNADNPTWVSADGCRLYFQTNRSGGSGGLDFHVAVRTPE
jgi:hypothetical protein